MSRQPANTLGWLATKPTTSPSMRPKATTTFSARCSMISMNSPSSTIRLITSRTSYGWFAVSGMTASSSRSVSVISVSGSASSAGGRWRLLLGRYEMRSPTQSSASASLEAT